MRRRQRDRGALQALAGTFEGKKTAILDEAREVKGKGPR